MKRFALKWLVVMPRYLVAGVVLMPGVLLTIVGALFLIASRALDPTPHDDLVAALEEVRGG
jgi:hypothetical protein